MSETREITLKRLKMRSWRRGMKEMDLILGPFSDGPLKAQDDAFLVQFDALLNEYDPDLYRWFSGQVPAPAEHADTIQTVLDNRPL